MQLNGIRILDLTRLLPGPFCSMLLADLGAEVIKIESPTGGDYARYYPPMVDDSSVFFHSINRNKKSVAIDLKHQDGTKIFRQLVGTADVVLESNRPGVMARLGLDFDALREHNPSLVMCAITGFGQTGAYSDRAGHDINYMALSGALSQNATDGGRPHPPGFQVADLAGGALYAAIGILAALFHRERTGEGKFIDTSMTDGALSLLAPMIAMSYDKPDTSTPGDGMLSGGVPCYDTYETADGRYLAVGCLEPKFWSAFVTAIERPDLVHDGMSRDPQVRETVASVLKGKPRNEWECIFEHFDACVEPVLTVDELSQHILHQTRENFFTLSGVQHIRSPSGFEGEPSLAPRLGEHTDDMLVALGHSEDEIDRLRQSGAIG